MEYLGSTNGMKKIRRLRSEELVSLILTRDIKNNKLARFQANGSFGGIGMTFSHVFVGGVNLENPLKKHITAYVFQMPPKFYLDFLCFLFERID